MTEVSQEIEVNFHRPKKVRSAKFESLAEKFFATFQDGNLSRFRLNVWLTNILITSYRFIQAESKITPAFLVCMISDLDNLLTV